MRTPTTPPILLLVSVPPENYKFGCHFVLKRHCEIEDIAGEKC